MAIITYPLNGIDYDAENAETYLCTRTSGVYSADGNFQASVTGDRQVTISTGLAWIRNTAAAGKSVYVSEPVSVNIPMADGTRDRLDRIVLRFDKAANRSEIVVKQGEPSSAAVAPSVERTELIYELGLCVVLCKAGSTLVDISDVTSTLLDESVCGLMRDGVTGIPTAQLQEQAEALIDELRRVITGVEDGSEYMLKAVFDPKSAGIDVTVQEYTHSKSGTVHEFTGQGANGRAKMTADVAEGDTFTVNGVPVTAYVGVDEATGSMAGSEYTGRWVTFVYDSEAATLNFKGGGGKVTVSGLSAGTVKKGTTVTVKQGAKVIQSVAGTYAPTASSVSVTTKTGGVMGGQTATFNYSNVGRRFVGVYLSVTIKNASAAKVTSGTVTAYLNGAAKDSVPYARDVRGTTKANVFIFSPNSPFDLGSVKVTISSGDFNELSISGYGIELN